MNAMDQSLLEKKKSFVSIPGHLFGYKTSCILVDVDSLTVEASQLHQVDAHLRKFLAEFEPMHTNLVGEKVEYPDAFAGLIYWIYLCLRIASVPRVTVGRAIRKQDRKIQRLVIPAPVRSHKAVFELIKLMVHLLDARNVGKLEAEIAQNLPMAINRIKGGFNGGSNVPHFLDAAMQLNVPVEEISASILQFGHGKNSRWLDSSFTDQTSQLSAKIARNKQIAARVLHDSGLPVAMNAIAKNIEDAHQISQLLRYPVVVKPADRDGGVGVAANLLNREEVAAAYEEAKKYSANVLVEKHIPGRDYRLTIFNGQLISAIERVPASVVGDGKHTVAELLDILNSDPRRGEGPHAVLKKVVLDDEAHRLLIAHSMTHTSVPKPGEFVLLRSRANVSSGGVPVGVLDRVHPDNRQLAIRAAKAIGLDFAGIDLITPDIGCSWMENGGAICEINAQPQLGSITSPHIYSEILKRILPDGGRIPISLIFGDPSGTVAKKIAASYADMGLTVGFSGRNGITVGDECVRRQPAQISQAGRILIRDRSVEAMVIEVNDLSVLRTGLPFDNFQKLIIAGLHFQTELEGVPIAPAEVGESLRFIIDLLQPACEQVIDMTGSIK